jgi:two-component system, LytTR family, sensor kinase
MQIRLPQYSGKDQTVFKTILLPYTLCMNFVIFGEEYTRDLKFFLLVSVVTIIAFTLFFTACGWVAVLVKNRFPKEQQVKIRMGIILPVVLLMSALFLFLLFRFYTVVPYFDLKSTDETFVWSLFILAISQIFLAFVHEGISRYQVWKQNQNETEKLKAAYQRSRLHGLRSQVNSHFLFNSLNSLSSLIADEGDEAERFLDEMSIVYRYMLRNETDALVTLTEELKFLQSYIYLLTMRFGEGLQFNLHIAEAAKQKMIAPLALQTVIENAYSLNTISKKNPLVISISAREDEMVIEHNLQPKTITEDFEAENGLDNLIGKYQLLSPGSAFVKDTETKRIVTLPLLNGEEEVAV